MIDLFLKAHLITSINEFHSSDGGRVRFVGIHWWQGRPSVVDALQDLVYRAGQGMLQMLLHAVRSPPRNSTSSRRQGDVT